MKHFFFSLKPRERFMALAALLVAATLWSTGAWGRVQGGWDAWRLLEEDALVLPQRKAFLQPLTRSFLE